jgi:4-hydroxybenzoate polyprenyltransferase
MTSACLLLGGAPTARLVAMAFCVASSSYAIDRIVDSKRDAHPSRTRALLAVKGLVPLSFALFAIAVLLGVTSEHPVAGLLTVAFPLSVALYVLPWMQHLSMRLSRAGFRRIKDIPFAKSFYVPACWSLLVLWAWPFFPRAGTREVAFAVLVLFPSLFVTAAACDLRDEQADRAAGIITFAVALGRKRALAMLRVIQAASMAAFLALSVAGLLPAVAGWLALSGLSVLWCLRRLSQPEADVTFFSDVVFDLLWVFQPLPAVAAAILRG